MVQAILNSFFGAAATGAMVERPTARAAANDTRRFMILNPRGCWRTRGLATCRFKTCRCQSWRSRPPGFLSRRAPGSDAPGRQLSDQTLLRAGTLATTLCDISSNPRATGKSLDLRYRGVVSARQIGRLIGSWA